MNSYRQSLGGGGAGAGKTGREGEEGAGKAVWGEMVEGLGAKQGNFIIQGGPSVK